MLTAALLPNADDYVLNILMALTKMGYGDFFVRQTERNIRQAELSLEHRQFRSEAVFPQTEDAQPRYKSGILGVIEGGYRLTLDEIQLALNRFREVIATRGAAPSFLTIINPQRNYKQIIEMISQKKLPNVLDDQRYDGDAVETASRSQQRRHERAKTSFMRLMVLRRYSPDIILSIERALPQKSRSRRADDARQVRSIVGLLKCYPIFERENSSVSERLNALFQPNSLFELTSRKNMFITPECLPECIAEASRVLDDLTFRQTKEFVRKKEIEATFGITAEQLEKIVCGTVKDAVQLRIRLAAEKIKASLSS